MTEHVHRNYSVNTVTKIYTNLEAVRISGCVNVERYCEDVGYLLEIVDDLAGVDKARTERKYSPQMIERGILRTSSGRYEVRIYDDKTMKTIYVGLYPDLAEAQKELKKMTKLLKTKGKTHE